MRKFLFALISFMIMGTVVKGQIMHEPFNYTSHATLGLSAQSGATWLIINTGDSILITDNSLTYAGLDASTGNKIKFDGGGTDYYRDFGTQTGGTIYSSFLLNISSLGGLTTTGGYFTGFIQSASTSNFGGTVWARQSTTAGKFNLGISTRSNSAVTWLTTDFDVNTTYFVVRAYDIIAGTANDVSRIWVNPVPGDPEPAAGATSVAGTDLTNVARVFLRQDNATNTPFIEIDEIRVGTTWASVTPPAAAPASITLTTPLPAFGNVCLNTNPMPVNSFTITGANLTTADVTIGALAGYAYSTNIAGPFTPTLSITQPGGAFSQTVYVQFTPTAVQSYDGNISVGGGGASSINVAASGAGINTVPTLTTGSATSVTTNSATAAGNIPANGCTAITAYGIEYSTTQNFPNGTGTQVPSNNIDINFNFSSNLTGLTPGTTYYFKAYATNAGGTGWGAEQSFTTVAVVPTINATSLADFGNVCINTTAGPNSFTINGSNLTTANVVVSALNGYTFSTTAGGTYTTTLDLVQAGGTFTQQVFVKFNPLLVQSYNGTITISGGGAANATVNATGAGVNTAATVTTGSASAITQTGATLAGSLPDMGCSAVTAYGIEYSTTNNFTPGTGTQVASSNISAGNFTSVVTGLTNTTTYYYRAYATNGGGTAYGSQQSFTTLAPPPPAITTTAITAFGAICVNTTSNAGSFTINGSNLTNQNITVGPANGYTFSTTAGGTYTPTLTLTQGGGTYTQQVFVKFSPVAVQNYNVNIPISGGGLASTVNVAVSGSGVNTPLTVTTLPAIDITTQSATFTGTANGGCSPAVSYGFEFSGVNGFANGTGTQIVGFPAGANFTAPIGNLVPGATYYYKAYATNNGGTSYGAQQSFTVASLPDGFNIYPVPAQRGYAVRFTMKNVTPGFYALMFYNSNGKLVHQRNMNIQGDYINQELIIPSTLMTGVYRVQLVNADRIFSTKSIMIF